MVSAWNRRSGPGDGNQASGASGKLRRVPPGNGGATRAVGAVGRFCRAGSRQALHARWQTTLSSVHGATSPAPRQKPGWAFSLAAVASNKPLWQATIAAGLLLVGVVIGHGCSSRVRRQPVRNCALRQEVTSTRELVTLSLLREQSAAERLRGVDYTTRMPAMDPQVVSALVQAVLARIRT